MGTGGGVGRGTGGVAWLKVTGLGLVLPPIRIISPKGVLAELPAVEAGRQATSQGVFPQRSRVERRDDIDRGSFHRDRAWCGGGDDGN